MKVRTKIMLIITILFIADVYSIKSFSKIKLKENNKIVILKAGIVEKLKKLENLKSYNFLMGALSYILNESNLNDNPLVAITMCVVNNIKLYKELKEKKKTATEEQKQSAELDEKEVAQAEVIDDNLIETLSKDIDEADEQELDLNDLEKEDPQKDNMLIKNNSLIGDSEIESGIKNAEIAATSEANATLAAGDEKKPDHDKWRKRILSIKKLKSFIGKFSGFFKKIKNFFHKISKEPRVKAMIEFFLCVTPNLMTIAFDTSTIFANIFNGSIAISIVKQSPIVFMNIVKGIRGIIEAKSNYKKTINDAKSNEKDKAKAKNDKFQALGKSFGMILWTLLGTFLGTSQATGC
jgi:hypothetical protein